MSWICLHRAEFIFTKDEARAEGWSSPSERSSWIGWIKQKIPRMWALLRCCAALLVMRPWSWWPSPQLGQFLPRSGVEWSRVSVIKYTVTWEQWPVWTKGVIEVFGDSTYTHNKARILKFARQWKSFQTSIPISGGEWLHTPPWPWLYSLWLWNILILKIIRIGWSRFAKYPNIIVWNVVDTFSIDTGVCRAAASHCSEMRCATSRCLLFIAFLTVLVI